MPQLELEGLTRRYGSLTALDHLSFSVSPGQVTGFLGPNGAGKTTTMRAVFGLTALDAGAIRWNGAPVKQAQRSRFGYMPEERGLYPGMRVGEQVEYFGRLHKLGPSAATAGAAAWLERLGIADRAGDKVESLSQGNQQRVQLATALVHDPDLLILDEPLSGLDPAGIDAVAEVLTGQARRGKCVQARDHRGRHPGAAHSDRGDPQTPPRRVAPARQPRHHARQAGPARDAVREAAPATR
jgi:ABC-2 type transport system ATP-binding protein